MSYFLACGIHFSREVFLKNKEKERDLLSRRKEDLFEGKSSFTFELRRHLL
jgi:hypothetical protein